MRNLKPPKIHWLTPSFTWIKSSTRIIVFLLLELSSYHLQTRKVKEHHWDPEQRCWQLRQDKGIHAFLKFISKQESYGRGEETFMERGNSCRISLSPSPCSRHSSTKTSWCLLLTAATLWRKGYGLRVTTCKELHSQVTCCLCILIRLQLYYVNLCWMT